MRIHSLPLLVVAVVLTVLQQSGGVMCAQQPFSGAFIDAATLPQASIPSYLDELKGMGVDTVILQNTRKVGTCGAQNTYTWTASISYVSDLASFAYQRNMGVYVGLSQAYDACTYYYSTYSPATILDVNVTLPALLNGMSADVKQGIKGWYIPDPAYLASWNDPASTYAHYIGMIKSVRYSSALPIVAVVWMAGKANTPATVAQRASDFQTNTNIDIQLYRDDVSGFTMLFPNSGSILSAYYTAISAAIGKSRMWGMCDLNNYGDPSPMTFPTSGVRILEQLRQSSPYVSKSFLMHPQLYMTKVGPSAVDGARRLYDTYGTTLFNGTSQYVSPASYTWVPSGTYPDSTGLELFNTKVGDPSYYQDGEWSAIMNANAVITIDMGKLYSLEYVTAHTLGVVSPKIFFPTSCIVRASNDSSNYVTVANVGVTAVPVASANGEYTVGNSNPFNPPIAARYIQVTLTYYSTWWVFLDEIELIGTRCDSTHTGALCEINTCASVGLSPNSTTAVSTGPVLNTTATKFENNVLSVVLNGPNIKTRTYTNVYVDGTTSSKCVYNSTWASPLWNVNYGCAAHTLTLSLPWVNHLACGFNWFYEDSNIVTFLGRIYITYTDDLSLDGVSLKRAFTRDYDVYLTFPKRLVVSIVAMNVSSVIPIDVALTAESYDSNSKMLTIEVTTNVQYSHMLASSSPALTTPATIMLVASTIDSSLCTQTAGSYCMQKMRFTLALVNNLTCSYTGSYTAATTLLACRDGSACLAKNVSFTFSLFSDTVCASIGIRPQLSGSLASYADSTITTPKTVFTSGDQIFFGVTVNSGSNAVSVQFINIVMTENSNQRYLVQNGVAQYGAGVLTVNNNARYFSAYVTSALFGAALSGTLSSYTFNATVLVTFQGNRKRMVNLEFDGMDAAAGFGDGLLEMKARVTIHNRHAAAQGVHHAPHATATQQHSKTTAEEHEFRLAFAEIPQPVYGVCIVAGILLAVVIVRKINNKNYNNKNYIVLQQA